jgi:curved DNA-binding protein CbpA
MKTILGQDHYSLLEVNRFAAKSEIVKAYHRLKAAFDPDSLATYSLFSGDEAREIRAQVEEAFRVLIDERKKEAYDRWLKAREHGEEMPEPVFSRDAANDQVVAAAVATAGTTEVKPFIPKRVTMLRPVPTGGFPRAEPPPEPPRPAPPPPPAPVALADEDAVKTLLASDRERDGAWLRAVREARGFSLGQVAEKTKIGQMYLRFIEENNYRDLPAPVYLRGHLVQFAKFLKLEQPEVFADAYMLLAEKRKSAR